MCSTVCLVQVHIQSGKRGPSTADPFTNFLPEHTDAPAQMEKEGELQPRAQTKPKVSYTNAVNSTTNERLPAEAVDSEDGAQVCLKTPGVLERRVGILERPHPCKQRRG